MASRLAVVVLVLPLEMEDTAMVIALVAAIVILAGVQNCQNPFGRPGERMWVGDQIYVCTTVGTWVPL